MMPCLPLYVTPNLAESRVQEKCSSLFIHNPERTAVVLGLLLEEMARCVRLSAYMCVKGIFPQAISTLRQAIELTGVYTSIWHEPQKADYVSDSDSPEYARAFRYTSDKTLQAQLKANKTQYRFMCCRNAQLMTQLYGFLSSQFVHAASLNTIGLVSNKDENLSCYFVDRVSPENLERYYQLVQTVLTLIYLEIFECLPKDDLMHDDLAVISIATATVFPILSHPEKTLEPEMSYLVDDAIEAIGNLEIQED